MVTIEDGNGTYTADTVAEAKKLKAARARKVKAANERYEAARARAERRAYLIMTRVLTCGYSPYTAYPRYSAEFPSFAEVKDAPDEFGTYNGRVNLHMMRDTDDLRGGEEAKLSHRGDTLEFVIADGGGIVRAVLLQTRLGDFEVHAVATYENADGHFECVTVPCPLVQHFHFRGDKKAYPGLYNLARALGPAVEQMDRDACAIENRRLRDLDEKAAAKKAEAAK